MPSRAHRTAVCTAHRVAVAAMDDLVKKTNTGLKRDARTRGTAARRVYIAARHLLHATSEAIVASFLDGVRLEFAVGDRKMSVRVYERSEGFGPTVRTWMGAGTEEDETRAAHQRVFTGYCSLGGHVVSFYHPGFTPGGRKTEVSIRMPTLPDGAIDVAGRACVSTQMLPADVN